MNRGDNGLQHIFFILFLNVLFKITLFIILSLMCLYHTIVIRKNWKWFEIKKNNFYNNNQSIQIFS